jgi:glycosyltransferase involved in cell wall biosynthesis
MQKQKILVLASTFPRWKGDTDPPFIYHLCKGMASYYEVHVLAPHFANAASNEILDEVHVHRYRYAPSAWQMLAYDGGMLRKIKKNPLLALLLPSFLCCQWLALRRLQVLHGFALIHAHWIIPQGVIAALAGVKFLLTSHGGDLYALNNVVLRALKRWILQRASHVTVVSNAMIEQCIRLGVPADKIEVGSMGVDTKNCFVQLAENNVEARRGILCVGRLVEKKGIAFLVEAMALLKNRGVQSKLTIIGGGPESDNLKRLVAEKGLNQAVTFLGAMRNADLPQYYQQAAIFVLPSIVSRDGDQEGLGLVSVEAMACGCPVIASDLPAVRDVIVHDVDGLLVAPASPIALANAIEKLLGDIELQARLAKAGIKKAEFFDWQSVCEGYASIIAKIIKSRS